jgi:AraC-like DNA-binding protein
VDKLWLHNGRAAPHAKERILPGGTLELVINLREDPLRVYDPQETDRSESFGNSLISGPYSEFFVIDTASQASVMGVHFRPGGAFPFLGLTAGELRNAHVSLEALWGRKANVLRERLLDAKAHGDRFRILERALLAQADRPLERHPAVAFALGEFDRVPLAGTVAGVTGRIGLSPRRFIQVFTEEVGLTPKLYCRIRRFQQVIRHVGAGGTVAWAEVALACGYFDQSHFIRDFRAFSGLSPSAYLPLRNEHLGHVPIPG